MTRTALKVWTTRTSPDSDVSDESDGWDSEGSEGAGWFADPDVEGQERYYDGSEWTSETRSGEPDAPVSHLPDHAGELQRALAAATSDIDDVEDRLGTLFDRAEQLGERDGRARKQAADEAAGRAAEGRALAESLEQADADAGWEEVGRPPARTMTTTHWPTSTRPWPARSRRR